MKKNILALLFFLWLMSILTAYFVVQKPDFFQILAGLQNLLLTLFIPLLMALLSGAIGAAFVPTTHPADRLILGTGLGLGLFGLAGFGLAALGWARNDVLWAIFLLLTVFCLLTGKLRQFWNDARSSAEKLISSAGEVAAWIPLSAMLAGALIFLLSLAPPAEDFDALAYHLTVPSWWLRDGGLIDSAWVLYWHPHLAEGIFLWPLALGADTASHLLHFLWFLLTVALLWRWAQRLWGNASAWTSLPILLSMPSILWLASLAYTDYTLTFFGLAMLYALWQWKNNQSLRWLLTGGLLAGMAIGTKYTGFTVPLTGGLLVLAWQKGLFLRIKKAFYFSAACVLVASPWYLRNWLWMNNPFYPFAFGGRFWDSFLAQAFSSAGTGIGLNWGKLLLLPLTATLGTQDTTFFDGRIGPFVLILAPLALAVFWQLRQRQNQPQQQALQAIGLFGLVSIFFWTVGVINTASLFQTRYLFYSLIPLAIPLALGLNNLKEWDNARLKISFIVRIALALVVFVNLFNFSLQILARNPLAAAVGIISRQAYLEQRQPEYASAVALVNRLPPDSKIYLLFEPRSYGMQALAQPDAINTNFSHDLWLYKTPEKVVATWKAAGYQFVLLARQAAQFGAADQASRNLLLDKTMTLLSLFAESEDGSYALYKIP